MRLVVVVFLPLFWVSLLGSGAAVAGFTVIINVPPESAPLSVTDGTQLNVFEGGQLGAGFNAFGGEVNIFDGSVGDHFQAKGGSLINIHGGFVGDGFRAERLSEVNITGGIFGDGFRLENLGEVNLTGRSFQIDGQPANELAPGVAFTIGIRDVVLTGELLDSSLLEFELHSSFTLGLDYFSPGGTLTVTLVPEPSTSTQLALMLVVLIFRRHVVSE